MTLVPVVTVCAILIFFIVYKISGFVSLGSILATLSMPLWYFGSSKVLPSAEYQPIIFFVLVATFFLITYSHRENIKRLVSGKELRASENAK